MFIISELLYPAAVTAYKLCEKSFVKEGANWLSLKGCAVYVSSRFGEVRASSLVRMGGSFIVCV